MPELPHCDELLQKFLDRWCDAEDLKRRGFDVTRPDTLQDDSLIGLSQSEASPLVDKLRGEVLHRIDTMIRAARDDWPGYLDVDGNMDLVWIESFDHYYGRERIAKVIERSDPSDFSNDYLVLCCEFGAVLGHVMLLMQPRLIWALEWPYWESALLDPKTGTLIPVFHWAVKKMSEYGVDDGFAEKVEACLQLLDMHEGETSP